MAPALQYITICAGVLRLGVCLWTSRRRSFRTHTLRVSLSCYSLGKRRWLRTFEGAVQISTTTSKATCNEEENTRHIVGVKNTSTVRNILPCRENRGQYGQKAVKERKLDCVGAPLEKKVMKTLTIDPTAIHHPYGTTDYSSLWLLFIRFLTSL